MSAEPQLEIVLVQAYIAAGMIKPVLPEGRRDEIIARLTEILTDREPARDYAKALRAERRRRDVDRKLFNADLPPDLPVEEILEHGLSVLTDDRLAALAIEPSSVLTLSEFLHEMFASGTCGEFWEEAFIASVPVEPTPEDYDWARDFIERQKALDQADEEFLAKHPECDRRKSGESGAPSQESGNEARSPSTLRLFRPLLAPVSALAATLLLGLFLGRALFQGGAARSPALVASAALSFQGARGGAERIPEITVESNARGFVSVLAVPPGAPTRPFVLPVAPDEDLPVGPDEDAASVGLPEPMRRGGAALVIVTRTPAADTLDKALFDERFSADELDRLEARVRDILRAKGHEQLAISELAIDPPEQ